MAEQVTLTKPESFSATTTTSTNTTPTTGTTKDTTHSDTTEDTVQHDTCPECDGHIVSDSAAGERHCTDCGLVVDEDEIDHGPEWRAFDATERDQRSRVGSPTTQRLHDRGLTTEIDWRDKDSNGNTLSSSQRQKMKRLRKWHRRAQSQSSEDRNLQKAFSELDRMSSALGIPDDVREVAAVIYRRALNEDLIRGRSIEAMISAALYAATRQNNIPRSLDAITHVSRLQDRKEIGGAYRYICKELGIEIAPVQPHEYIEQFASDVDASRTTREQAKRLTKAYANEGLHSGKTPTGVAAGAIYTIDQLNGRKDGVTQKDLSETADVSAVTIRNRWEELRAFAEETDVINTTPTIDPDEPETTDESETATEMSASEAETAAESSEAETAADVPIAELDVQDGTRVLVSRLPDGVSQSEALAAATELLIEECGLLDEIEMPYCPPRFKNTWLNDEPANPTGDMDGAWKPVADGAAYVQTKLAKNGKHTHIEGFADEVGVAVEFDW